MSNPCHIRLKKEKILNHWEQLSRDMFPAASEKSRAAVRNHLPELVDALCNMIESGVLEKPKELGETHGRQRFSFGDYTLSQVIDEYWLLKKIIFDEIETTGEVVLTEFRLTNQFFETAATSAACEFSALRENEILKATRHLEISNQDLERFAAVAAHDLRAPVATIIGYVDIALDEIAEGQQNTSEMIKPIKNIGVRMIELIDKLLEYTKLGKSELKTQRFSLAQVAEEAKSNLKNSIIEAAAEVRIEKLPEIDGDPILFLQLFQNLISNSLKFRSDKRTNVITVSGRLENKIIKICVKDNGIGFDPELNLKIFEPFNRGTNSKNIKGSGLGLATVQKIVELYNGRISAIGKMDEGAEFYIELPVLR